MLFPLGNRLSQNSVRQAIQKETNENECLEQEGIEGYLGARDDRAELDGDWQIVDGESLPSSDAE